MMVQQPHWEYADTIVQCAMQLMHEHGQELDGNRGPSIAYVLASGIAFAVMRLQRSW